ncbi:zinc finger, CCHC-type containing protein, partial [Tanacetum coccineum]
PYHGIDRWLQIQIFYDHVSFHLKCEIDRAAGGKLRHKNIDESWEIIENLALNDHEGWDETKEFFKPVKVISTPQGIPKTPDRRLLKLEDQINFLLKGSRPTPTSSSAHTPQTYVNAVHLNSHPQNQNEPPILSTFAFCKRTCPSPQPQALETTFEARVRDYMAAHIERMEGFENTIFKQREEINGRIAKMFELLRNSRPAEPLRKTKETPDNTEKLTETEMEMPIKEVEKMNEVENRAEKNSIKRSENEEAVEAPVGKKKGKEYKVLPGGPAYDAILKKKITKKEDIRGNFEIPCGIGDLKHVNALVDQGSDVNVMPYSTYMRLTDERTTETNIRLSLASHLYIYPLGIAVDVLVEVTEHVFPVEFVILDIKENKKRPFILGTPFLTTAKATIKFDTCTINLRLGKSKVSFHRIYDSSCITDKGVKNDIELIAPIMIVNRLVLEGEERIKLHLKKEMKFNQ